ncbi:polysaccharide deacetylase family protein [Fictibacillus terranigra]|uniref:Polysaccharide deacetylase family protein n=1 Tax=Fictibacillus terranigra TaxID=3058424 RepID=A0ABT8ECZ5_9BACL|nr:polysaccharide deacetylase family protein [Fictibacillus sp. CENA-BCM004]MDN4075806.1 polysaccharide deacetylase family protein [Fictibacillus sp. CENA-BCM004]
MIILSLVFLLLFVFFCYAIIPTVLIRVFSIGIMKSGNNQFQIALTFDDGPHPEYTEKLLDLLGSYQASAAFFIVGERAQSHPHLLDRMCREGHAIGIHHQTHSNSWFLLPYRLREEIGSCASVIKKITGKDPLYYRPPWGRFNLFSLTAARKYQTIMWSSISQDWKASQGKEKLAERLKRDLGRGKIYLLHDNGDNPGADEEAPAVMLEALREFLEFAQQKGYRFVSLDELKKKQ